MDALRSRVTVAIVSVFLGLLVADMIDDMAFGNHWTGVPPELYAVVGAVVAGLYASQAVRRNGNGGDKHD